MRNKKIEMVGRTQGMLTVVSESHKTTQGIFWNCICACGKTTVVLGQKLRNGHTKSCGCLQVIKTIEANTKHGLAHTRLNNIHAHMKKRCNSTSHKNFRDYGGRGIRLCEEWQDFGEFAKWALRNGYSDNLTIERINNDGNYEPNNCKWIPLESQATNRRKPRTNKSGYPGVFFDKRMRKYSVTVKNKGVQIYMGSFSNLNEAIEVKREHELRTFGKHLYEKPTEAEIKAIDERYFAFVEEVTE